MRRLLCDHVWIAALVVAAALLLRVVVPAGFMTTTGADGRITVMVCSGEGSRAMTIAIPGLDRGGRQSPGEHEKAGTTCAFAGLAAPFLGGVDPILLLAALAIVASVGLHTGQRFRPLALNRLRPPLRGPPAASIA